MGKGDLISVRRTTQRPAAKQRGGEAGKVSLHMGVEKGGMCTRECVFWLQSPPKDINLGMDELCKQLASGWPKRMRNE
jgi:hypothetical protein